MGDKFTTAARTRMHFLWRVRAAGALAAVMLFAGACGAAAAPDISQGVASLSMNDTQSMPDTDLSSSDAGPPVSTAVAAAPTPQPELPPPSSDEGDPIANNLVMGEALGLDDVCSLYEASRLSELLGEFWTMTEGIPVDQKCLWVSAKDSESSAVVSIETLPTHESNNAGTTVGSDTVGPGLAVSVAGTEYVVNVVTDDVDAERAELNVREAEERIVADILARAES